MVTELRALAKSICPAGVRRAVRVKQASLLFQKFVYACYYKFLFGEKSPLAARLAKSVATWEKRHGRGDIPMSRETWESEYGTERWSYLDHMEELGRYSIVVGYIQFLKPKGSILDAGCGEGILLERLSGIPYGRYVGIDIAQTAIDKAAKRVNGQSVFAQADVQTFVPSESFDAIVFNEVLYYVEQPLEVVRRYEAWLKPGGVFVASLYAKSTRGVTISNRLKDHYREIDGVRVSTNSAAWIIDVFVPKSSGGLI
jgi:2-polyprenyl-3-methyl-5-hydroxy-6-metoxy-1,4-benzoquinol methylase